MVRMILALGLLAFVAGCSGLQANRASQAVDFDPGAIGTGQPVLTPASGPGFSNGQAMDMRSHR